MGKPGYERVDIQMKSAMRRRCGISLRMFAVAAVCSSFNAAPAEVNPHPPSKAFAAFPTVDEPLPGYEPIRLQDRTIHFRNCTVALGKDGLIEAITHEGVQLLSRGMTISGHVDGRELSLAMDDLAVRKNTGTTISTRTTGRQGRVSCTVDTTVEYDGLARFVIKWASPPPVEYKDLCIHIPIDSKQADYFYDFKSFKMPAKHGVLWNSQKSRIMGVSIGRFMNMFAPYVWIGNYHRGISWFAESDAGWQDQRGKPVWTITRRKGEIELTVHVIMGETEKDRFTLDFGIMVAPIRRPPKNAQNWVFAGMGREYWDDGQDALPEDAYSHIPDYVDRANVLMFSCDFNNALEERHAQYVRHPRELSRYVRKYHDAGFSKVIYYTCMNLMTDLHPEYDRIAPGAKKEPELLREWPGKRVPDAKQHKYLSMCPNSRQNLAMVLELTKTLVSEHDVDGIYLDNFMYTYNCQRPGCTFDKRGRKQPGFRIYQYRDFMKKLASIFVRHGKEPLIWVHHTGIMMFPVMSFATMGLSGEIMSTKNKSQFNHVELFDEAAGVVELNSKSWGVPILWYPDLKYGIYTKNRPDAPLTRLEYCEKYGSTYLGMCMLYGSIPVSMNADPNTMVFRKVMAARYAFGMSAEDVAFHPYWEPHKGVRLAQGGKEGVRASVFTRGGKILIVLVNFGSSATDIQVVLSDEMLVKTYRGSRLRDCVAEGDVELPGGRCRLSLGGHGFTILLGEADRPVGEPGEEPE